ncbi:BSD domain-containing protein 1-A-like [Gossypium australe]|uniref:BSD domain-containing protein 1-A-like n=1 Tax=Gossypium australe TaxID=47621 RepID=A0A5B6W1X2_9ROSI|nr:BSD domain-containing protein 1-A-like [Gossypium australe]
MTGEKLGDWMSWLPLGEWWYNSTFHLAIQTTPYEALYGQAPPQNLPYLVGAYSKEKLQEGYSSFILEGSGQMKQLANQNRRDKEFQQTVRKVLNQKLSPKYIGPFAIKAKVGKVAYRFQLPSNWENSCAIYSSSSWY